MNALVFVNKIITCSRRAKVLRVLLKTCSIGMYFFWATSTMLDARFKTEPLHVAIDISSLLCTISGLYLINQLHSKHEFLEKTFLSLLAGGILCACVASGQIGLIILFGKQIKAADTAYIFDSLEPVWIAASVYVMFSIKDPTTIDQLGKCTTPPHLLPETMKTNPKLLIFISALLIVGGIIGLFVSIQKPIFIPAWLLGLLVIVGVSMHVYILAKPSPKSEMDNCKDKDNS